MILADYDLVIINSSGGKDSLCTLYEVCRIAESQKYDFSKIVVSHQDLGEMEWKGTKDLVQEQADFFGLQAYYSKRRDKYGNEGDLLDYVEKRGMWPSRNQRYCTSDFKRGPGARVVTMLTKDMGECKVLYVFGFRKSESPARSQKKVICSNKRLTTKKRKVDDWLPIHDWSDDKVWDTIHSYSLPYHPAYDLGMPRLSCCFCIFSPFNALVIAGRENPELLDRYIQVEEKIQHNFRDGFSLKEVRAAIQNKEQIIHIDNWVM